LELTSGVDQQIKDIGNKSPTFAIRRWNDGKLMAMQALMDMGKLLPDLQLTIQLDILATVAITIMCF
jgi:hypothetical protein